MDPSRGVDSRYNMNYSMSGIGLGLVDQADIYGNPAAVAALGGRQPSGCLIQPMSSVGVGGLGSRGGGGSLMPNTSQCTTLGNPNQNSGSVTVNSGSHQRGLKRAGSDCYDDNQNRQNSNIGMSNQSMQGLDGSCNSGSNTSQQQQQQQQQQQHHQSSSNVSEVEESYVNLQNKKSPPANGKKTKGRVKIKMEYIDNKLRRYTTFSKRKTGIMKKAYELSTLTGTQVMLLVASETGHVYTFATRKLQPMITSEAGKQLIQTCLNSPDPPSVGGGDQRMSATGFEETELSYNITDEDSKEDLLTSENESDDSSDAGAPSQSVNKTTTTTSTASKTNQEQFISSQQQQQHATALEAPEIDHKSSVQNLTTAINRQTAAVGQDKLQTKPPAAAAAVVAADNNEKNVVLTSEAFANLPKEILLELIKSGHLQLHAEEDGSGHQYVAIPLKPTVAAATAAASISSNMKSANRAQLNTNLAQQLDKSATTTPAATPSSSSSMQSSSSSSSVAYNDVTIKQEKF